MFVVFGTRGVARAVDRGAGTARRIAVLEPIAQRAEPRALGVSFAAAQRAPRRPGRRCRDVLGARAPVPLVLAAGQDRRAAARRA